MPHAVITGHVAACGSIMRGSAMEGIRRLFVAIVIAAIVTTGLWLAAPSAKAGKFGAGPSTDQLIREGQVVEISDTTVTIREWAGKYTYRLSPTGQQSLRANQIR